VFALVVGAFGCATSHPHVVEPIPQRLPQDLIVLLSDADGTVGRAVVSTPSGTVDLGVSGASTTISATQAPSSVAVISDSDVQQVFGEALSALPPPPLRFTFYFEFQTEELTPESRARVPMILEAVREYPVAEVIVVGHTDTTGSADKNVELGLKRATAVRELLLAARVATSAIEVRSHGEVDPALATADEVQEPLNRRVEVTVR
jgi:outer membrane protein OmpA-like peptidoglycan-associated protein